MKGILALIAIVALAMPASGVTVGSGSSDFGANINSLPDANVATLQGVGVTHARNAHPQTKDMIPGTTLAAYISAMNAGCPGGSVCDPNTWNWASDAVHTSERNHGMRILDIYAYGVPWDTNDNHSTIWPGIPSTSDQWRAWEDMIAKETTHYHPDMIEVWNEPDGSWFVFIDPTTYANLYYHTAHAIRSVNSTVAIGGPVVSAPGQVPQYINAMHANTNIPNSWINFISYHGYIGGSATEDTAAAAAARNIWPGIPVYVTEWTWDTNCGDTIDGDDPNGVAWFGSRYISQFYSGQPSDYFSGALDSSTGVQHCAMLFSNGTPMPKDYAIFVMSKQLGLGAGPSSIKATTTNLTSAAGAANSAGNPVAIMANWSGGRAVTVTFNNVANKTWNLQTYLADHGSNHAQSPIENINVPVTNGTLVHTFNMTDYSIAGVILK